MAVGSIQSGWGYGGITYDFNVDFVAPRIQLQDENRDVPVMSSEGEARFRAQGEALETALERGTSLSSTDNTQEIIEARAAIDALIEQVGRYGGNTASLAALRNGITTPQQAQAAVFEAIQVSATLLQNATTDRDTARIVASNLNRVLDQAYLQEAQDWFRQVSDEGYLHSQLVFDRENNPTGIYERDFDGVYRIRSALIVDPSDVRTSDRMYEMSDGRIYNRITGQEVPATLNDAINQIQGLANSGLATTITTGDVAHTRDAQIGVADRLASMNVIVDVTPDPRVQVTAERWRMNYRVWTPGRAWTDEQIIDDLSASLEPGYTGPIPAGQAREAIAALQADGDMRRLSQRQELLSFDGVNDRQDVQDLAELVDVDNDGRISDAEFAAFTRNNDISAIASVMRGAGVLNDRDNSNAINEGDILGELNAALGNQAQQRGGAETAVTR